MSRKKSGRDVHGWIVLDKPSGMSSSQAVGRVRWLLDAKKAGHAGTLDPLATGILPIGLGEATKSMSFLVDAFKEYVFTVKWGEERSTGDVEGVVTQTHDHKPDESAIKAILPRFHGVITQVPPLYSAIKVDGKRAYALARAGKTPALAARSVMIRELSYLGGSDRACESRFVVTCGKGTYIRSLASDLAHALGTVGHVTSLRRTRVGPFREEQAISLEKLEELGHGAPADTCVLPVMTALDDIPVLAVTAEEADRIRKGQRVRHESAGDGRLVLLHEDLPVTIVEGKGGVLRPMRVFNF